MSEQLSQAIVGASASLLTAALMWMRERRRDVSEDRVTSSADNRAWAEIFRAELDRERAERRRVEAELAIERQRTAELSHRVAELTARVAELERVISGEAGHA